MRQLTFLARAVSVEQRKKACWNGKSKWEVKIGKTDNSFKNCCEGKQRGGKCLKENLRSMKF